MMMLIIVFNNYLYDDDNILMFDVYNDDICLIFNDNDNVLMFDDDNTVLIFDDNVLMFDAWVTIVDYSPFSDTILDRIG